MYLQKSEYVSIIAIFYISLVLFGLLGSVHAGIANNMMNSNSTAVNETLNDAHWDDGFKFTNGFVGSPIIKALTLDENGDLYVGGHFAEVGGISAHNVAKWDGNSWSSLGEGTNGLVNALVFDSSGNLYIGGGFSTAGGEIVNNIAKWDGENWAALGDGLEHQVMTLVMDGLGNLYAGGAFTSTLHGVAKWDGIQWSSLGSGTNGTVHILTIDVNDHLYAGGEFTNAGGELANNIAFWNGSTWSDLGNGTNATVRALALDTAGNLYVGGDFTSVDGTNANYIASWNGSEWSVLGSGMNDIVYSLLYHNSGDLYAAGDFATSDGIITNHLAKWDGDNWNNLDSGVDDSVFALIDNGVGVIAGGVFNTGGGINAQYIARWNGQNWTGLVNGVNNTIYALDRDESGRIYAGGTFDYAGGGSSSNIARWNGIGWSNICGGLNRKVNSIVVPNDIEIYAGGHFTSTNGSGVNYIAKCEGDQWSALGTGMNNAVNILVIDDEGKLYAGGFFTIAGGEEVNHIARWDGSVWSGVGGGVNVSGLVRTLSLDSSNNLYAGGNFSAAGGVPVNNIARWDGNNWSSLGAGTNNRVNTIVIIGSDLYAGGSFTTAGGTIANYIAHWDGANWSALGDGLNGEVYTLAINQIGNIIVGGDFTTAGGIVANHIAVWDGYSWSALGSGVDDIVYALHNGVDDFYAGGAFMIAGYKPSFHIARWFNSEPVSIGDNYSTDEDVALNVPIPGVLLNDLDPEDDPLSTTSVVNPAHGILNINYDGSFAYTPDENYYGSDHFIYLASDRFLTDTATVTITINATNDPPSINPIDDQQIDEGHLLSFTVTAIDLETSPEDLVFSLGARSPAGASISHDGVFTWLPDETQGPGIYSVTVQVSDDGIPPLIDEQTLNIDVSEVNTAPLIDWIEDRYIIEGNLLTFTVTASDVDLPANSIEFSLDPNSPIGASITKDGIFTWTPNESQGPGIFAITVWGIDNGIPPLDDSDQFIVTLDEENQAPYAKDDFYFVRTNYSLSVFAPGILWNDGDADIPPNPLKTELIFSPSHGSLTLNLDGSFIYTPDIDFIGEDIFTYSVNDGLTLSNVATVTITVISGYRNYLPIINR